MTSDLGGRPSKYQPRFVDDVERLCAAGATDYEIAKFLRVSLRSITTWKSRHPEFARAFVDGKASMDDRVKRSLYHRAVGYTFASEKLFCYEGDVTRAKTLEHVPPDVNAARFWLANRDRENWRERQEVETKGEMTVNVTIRRLTDDLTPT